MDALTENVHGHKVVDIRKVASYVNVYNTQMQESVIECLEKDIDMPTKDIINEVDEMWEGRIIVKERFVQKIRKALKDALKGVNSMKGLHQWQIDVLNMANEGGWSIQQIAEKVNADPEDVRETLQDFHYMVHNREVLDEENPNVFFDQDTKGGEVIALPAPGAPETNRSASNEEYWEVPLPDCVTACSKVEQSVDVFMSKCARIKAMHFMKWAKHREWLAYLVGTKTEKGYEVTDLYIPDQRTSATLVDKVNADKYNQLSIVGVIHSHHDMGAGDEDHPSFSGHDAEFINSNHNLSLLAGNKREGGFKIVGIARTTTPCGGLMRIKANVKALPEQPSEEELALKNEFFEKVFNRTPDGEALDTRNEQYHFTNRKNIGG